MSRAFKIISTTFIHRLTWDLPEQFWKQREIINFHNYWFLIWPSYFNLSEIIEKERSFLLINSLKLDIEYTINGYEIEKEYGKENCIDRNEIPPIIIDFDDDESSDEESWIQSNMITDCKWQIVHNVFTYTILFISNNNPSINKFFHILQTKSCIVFCNKPLNLCPNKFYGVQYAMANRDSKNFVTVKVGNFISFKNGKEFLKFDFFIKLFF
jgi:hypothetical protein